MNFKHHIITVFVLAMALYSCEDKYLDVKNVEADVSIDKLYSTYTYVRGVVWNTYSYLPDGFAHLDMEAASDNAEATNEITGVQLFNSGTWNQFINTDDTWSNNFSGIRQANLFLEHHSKINIDYIKNGIIGTDSTEYYNARNNVKFMKGEVLFLKAFFYFDLVKRYGGVPLFDTPFDYKDAAAWKSVSRNSLNECLKYISNLCDTAATIIPANLSPYGWYEKGRVTNGAILALKSKVLLYGASPLYKDNGSTVTWVEAAKAAHDVIELHKYSLPSDFSSLFGSNNTQSGEIIFERRYGASNSVEYANYPILFDKSTGNSVTPTQNLVDAFEVITKDANGEVTGSVPFDWNNPVHAANPYANRDPRFYATVVYNGSAFRDKTIETFTGGNSGLPTQNATKTGYYLAKWVNKGVDLVNNTTATHTWSYFRYGEILLNYAEAMFNAYGASEDPAGYGMTAIQAFNLVRERVGLPDVQAEELTQQKLENERNVELCFEDHRFWDVRRWKKAEAYFGSPVKKVVIAKTGSTANPVFTYKIENMENRVFLPKMHWYPIPQSEITKTGWTQNPSW